MLGERGGGALGFHCTDGGGQRTVSSTGDCGGVRGRKGALKENTPRSNETIHHKSKRDFQLNTAFFLHLERDTTF